jgi:hypothetical protein
LKNRPISFNVASLNLFSSDKAVITPSSSAMILAISSFVSTKPSKEETISITFYMFNGFILVVTMFFDFSSITIFSFLFIFSARFS